MTDTEILAFAAKAAGYDFLMYDHAPNKNGTKQPCRAIYGDQAVFWQPWNPLLDDGEALRLAARLSIGIPAAPGPVPAESIRRTITRVAAEIGKAMPCL